MQRRKCIGVFLGQPHLPFQTEILKHIRNHAFIVGSNVTVFSSMVYTKGYPDFQYGESQNVALANFDLMDAVIVVPDTLQASDTDAQEVLEYIRQHFQGPRVVLDMEAEGFQQFFSDDTESVDYLVSHLIEMHHCTDIAYMTGKKNHPHSISRLDGYYQAMERHGLPVDESRVFYGDFWYNEGENVVKTLLASERGLPQAVACANDAMAVSVFKALTEHGYRIPEDILVTGFDHAGNASSGNYPITSAMRNAGEMTGRAMQYIFKEWGLANLPKYKRNERLVLHKSCGCKVEKKQVYQLTNQNSLDGFYSEYNFMLEDMISSKDIESCIWKIDWYAGKNSKYLNRFSHLRLCLCEGWNSFQTDYGDSFSDNMLLALDKRPDDTGNRDIRFGMDVIFPRKEYFPGFGAVTEDPAIYYFNVLHFEKNCFGYLVLSYNSSCEDHVYNEVYPAWVRKINCALESLRRQYVVEALYRKAEARAITDTMTGLYNRNGYNKYLSEMIGDIQENETFVYLFFDNNGLKYINDTYGHVAGDDVICQTARIMSKNYFPEARKELNFRIGGDEYVKLVLGSVTETMAERCIQGIHEELNRLNASGGREYPIYVAGGYQIYNAGTIMSPDEIMKAADQQMYDNKELLKDQTGFRPVRKK